MCVWVGGPRMLDQVPKIGVGLAAQAWLSSNRGDAHTYAWCYEPDISHRPYRPFPACAPGSYRERAFPTSTAVGTSHLKNSTACCRRKPRGNERHAMAVVAMKGHHPYKNLPLSLVWPPLPLGTIAMDALPNHPPLLAKLRARRKYHEYNTLTKGCRQRRLY